MAKRIGIFDSGVGGLSVLYDALEAYPREEYLYYADEKNVPYGRKSMEDIRGYVDEVIRFFLKKEVDAVLIACNTATSAASKEYREGFPVPIIGMEPAIKKAVEEFPDEKDRILIAATPATIRGEKLCALIEKVHRDSLIDKVALPELVNFAQAGEFSSREVEAYLRETLRSYPVEEYGALVLGCTHFNYFKKTFMKIFRPNLEMVDGNQGTLNRLGAVLSLQRKTGEPGGRVEDVRFYFSGIPAGDREREIVRRCMKVLSEAR